MGKDFFERLGEIQGGEINLVHITAEATGSVGAVDMSTLSTAVAFPTKDLGEEGLAFLHVGRGQHEIEELHLRATPMGCGDTESPCGFDYSGMLLTARLRLPDT